MATRTGFPGTTSSGDVLHSADVTKLPGGAIGYVEKTTDVSGVSSITDISGLSVTVTAGTSRKLKITGHFGVLTKDASGGVIKAYIRQASTTLATFINQDVGASERIGGEGSAVVAPSSGSNTYKLSLESGSGDVDLVCSGDSTSWILVEDLGPDF